MLQALATSLSAWNSYQHAQTQAQNASAQKCYNSVGPLLKRKVCGVKVLASGAQAETRELRAERRVQCAARLEGLQERERLAARLTAADRTSAQLGRQLDAAAARAAAAQAASSAMTQRLAAASAELSALRGEAAAQRQRLASAEAAAGRLQRKVSDLEQDNAALQEAAAGPRTPYPFARSGARNIWMSDFPADKIDSGLCTGADL